MFLTDILSSLSIINLLKRKTLEETKLLLIYRYEKKHVRQHRRPSGTRKAGDFEGRAGEKLSSTTNELWTGLQPHGVGFRR